MHETRLMLILTCNIIVIYLLIGFPVEFTALVEIFFLFEENLSYIYIQLIYIQRYQNRIES